MGKILSGPKAPSVQYVVSNPTSTSSTTDSATSTATDTSTQADESQISSELRTESLLRRSRGRLGTVTSSFRGFLDSVGNTAETARKTLLGE